MVGQRSNQLNYVPTRQINKMRNNQCLCGFAPIAYRALIAFPCLKERSYRRNRPKPPTNFWSDCRIAQDYTRQWQVKEHRENEPRKNIVTPSLPARKGELAFPAWDSSTA